MIQIKFEDLEQLISYKCKLCIFWNEDEEYTSTCNIKTKVKIPEIESLNNERQKIWEQWHNKYYRPNWREAVKSEEEQKLFDSMKEIDKKTKIFYSDRICPLRGFELKDLEV